MRISEWRYQPRHVNSENPGIKEDFDMFEGYVLINQRRGHVENRVATIPMVLDNWQFISIYIYYKSSMINTYYIFN